MIEEMTYLETEINWLRFTIECNYEIPTINKAKYHVKQLFFIGMS